jgi:hypothetical protein
MGALLGNKVRPQVVQWSVQAVCCQPRPEQEATAPLPMSAMALCDAAVAVAAAAAGKHQQRAACRG